MDFKKLKEDVKEMQQTLDKLQGLLPKIKQGGKNGKEKKNYG